MCANGLAMKRGKIFGLLFCPRDKKGGAKSPRFYRVRIAMFYEPLL